MDCSESNNSRFNGSGSNATRSNTMPKGITSALEGMCDDILETARLMLKLANAASYSTFTYIDDLPEDSPQMRH